jgi:hypothetical protein
MDKIFNLALILVIQFIQYKLPKKVIKWEQK